MGGVEQRDDAISLNYKSLCLAAKTEERGTFGRQL